jgi:hypothetical protein
MSANTRRALTYIFAVGMLSSIGCADEDPKENNPPLPDGGVEGDECPDGEPAYTEDVSGCDPPATDYQPRDNGSANDDWDQCISDDNSYHQIEDSVSSIARVEAYDQIGELLWHNSTPTPQDFLDARVIYEEEQGLGSRVARRWDPHYDPPPAGSCEDEGIPEQYPDYCVGPATLQPIVVAAFADGVEGQQLAVNAGRIEAALQWFLYVSAIKEATTCTDTAKDCDSCWAYYSGGTPRETPIGLAFDIDCYAPETHDRAYDGVLAVRCWRDLDSGEIATDLELRDLAIGQLDFALLRGMSILARQRFLELECSTGDYQQAALEELRVLMPLLDRETRERDAATADLLAAEVAKDADAIDVDAVVAAIDAVYPCP